MLDIIKKSVYFGLGAATATREKVESLVEELIEKGQVRGDQKAAVVQDFLDRIDKEQKAISDRIKTEIRKVIEEIGLPTKKDIEGLNRRLQALEKKLSEKKS